MIWLNDHFSRQWADKEPFEQVERLTGQVFRAVKSRRTLRFELAGKGYFAKIHHGVGWFEIVKNLLMLKRPIIGARNEYEAIRKLEQLGVATMTVAAFGERGINPARRESFIITRELTGTASLEDVCRDWAVKPPPLALKKALIEYLAKVSATLHLNGVNHRDYYICHFLLDVSRGLPTGAPGSIRAHLIDLHRAQLRRRTPSRWVVKDVAGLWFSAMDLGLTRADRLRFVRAYSRMPLREALGVGGRFWRRVELTARRLYLKELKNRRGPVS